MKKKKKNNLKRNVFQVISVGMALMMPMTSIAATATPSEIGIDADNLQQYDSETSGWGDSATETAADDKLNDHSENTYDGKIHLFFDTTGGQWLDPSNDGPDGTETNAHDNGTYVITIPTKISYENMNIGRVDTSDTYDVNIRGAIGQNEKVKLTAETDKPLVNGDKSEITETTHMGANADAAVYGERTFNSSQVYGGLNSDGSLAGTTVQDTITMEGEVTTAGVYEGSVQYNAELVKDSTTPENQDTQTAAKKYMQYLTPGKNVTKNDDGTFLATPGDTSSAYLTLDTSSYFKSDSNAAITATEITVNDKSIATAEAIKDKYNDNYYDYFIDPVANGETTATIEVTFADDSKGTATVNITVTNQADTPVENSDELVIGDELVNGNTFNENMAQLVEYNITDVKKIARTNTEPEDPSTFKDISLAGNGSAKMTYDSSTKTINIWTSADKFKMNKNSSLMFYNFSGIETLDLSMFDTSQVTDISEMFYNCPSLKTIYVSDDFDTSKITGSTEMFYYCTALEGGNGTKYDADHIDASYAHIDAEGNPGYFTRK